MSSSEIAIEELRTQSRGGDLVIRLLIGAFFIFAAVTKATNPDAFGVVVWQVLGEHLSPSVAVALGVSLAAGELLLGLLVILDRRSRIWLRATIVLLIAFCLVLFRLMTMANPPTCGCLSVPLPGGTLVEQVAGLGRNVALIWLAVISLSQDREVVPFGRPEPRSAGFSLLELLVVIVVIAIILGISLPVLGRVRWTSKSHERAIEERQVFSALSLYVDDQGDAFPYFGTRGQPYGPVEIGSHVFTGGDYFSPQRWYWATVLTPSYVPDRRMIEDPERAESLAGRGRGDLVAAHAQLTSTAMVDPAYFAEDAPQRPFNPMHFRGTRRSEIAFPSDKVILVSFYGGPGGESALVGERGGYPVVYGDASTRIFTEQQILTMPTIERPLLGEVPIHGTLGGLAGRDVLR